MHQAPPFGLVLVCFLVSLLVFYFGFRGLSKVAWKRWEYVALALGGFGLIGALAESERAFSETDTKSRIEVIDANGSYVKQKLSDAERRFCAPDSEQDPEGEAACRWLQNRKIIILDSIGRRQTITVGQFDGTPPQEISYLEATVKQYNERLAKYGEGISADESGKPRNGKESFILLGKVFGPCLLVIAAAFKIVQNHAEIRDLKAAQSSLPEL